MKRKRMILWLLVVLWMGLIFFFSAQPADVSGEQSGGLIRLLLAIFSPDFDTLLPSEQLAAIERLQHTVRKLTHFGVYGCLGMLCRAALYQHKIKTLLRPILAVIIASFYAISDEIHQWFVPGRSCEFRDVCIDSFGAVCGVLFLMLCIQLIVKIRKSCS